MHRMRAHHHHHDSHGHHHHGRGHAVAPTPERRTLLAFVLTAGFMVVEAAGGWLAGSLALIADATHMLTDAIALLLAWLAFRLGRMAADRRRSYGYRRFEVLAALINGALVVALAAWIVWEAAGRLAEPSPVLGLPMLAVAVLGLLVNVLVLRTLHGHTHGEEENLNLRGASLHVLGDTIGSAAAVVAAVVILSTGWTPIDPLLSLGVAALILINAWQLIRQSAHILLEGVPEGFDEAEVRRCLERIPGVADVHHVHAWSLTSGEPLVTLHLRLAEGGTAETVLSETKSALAARFRLAHSVVQLERGDCPDAGDRCA
jgi:cobalt-zinc-cadmium efflux system protein